jgi:hypothetical protein
MITTINSEDASDKAQRVARQVAGGAPELSKQPEHERVGLYLSEQEFLARNALTVDCGK